MTSDLQNRAASAATDRYSPLITAQAIAFLYDNIGMALYAILLMPVGMVFVMWGRVSPVALFAWSAVIVAIIVARLLLVRAYRRRNPPPEEAPRWGHYFSLTALANGLAWGIAGVFFFTPDAAVVQVFLYTCVIGLAAGSIIIYAYWLESYYAFIVPALALCTARLVAEGGGYQWLGLMLAVLAVILFRLGRNTSAQALAAIRLRYENVDLIEKLWREKESAEEASRDKTRFLASASHDLRQPIHALTLYSEALRADIETERGRNMLASMGRSIDALNQLLGSLLDISKLDAEIVQPNCIDFPLRHVVSRLDEEYAPQAKAKGLGWHVEAGSQVVYSDPVLLETMLRNLISNAIRYTHKGGIVVQCWQEEREVIVEVADTGIGIPQEQQREVFREFFQLANPERDRSQGLGLGLSIVERLARLLHHRVTLESEPGEGTHIAVIMKAGDPATLQTTASSQWQGSQVTGNWESLGMRVLVIDDEDSVLDSMRMLLEGWGCEVLLADSEEAALLTILDGELPQVILADYRLRDGKTGVQAIELLRRETGKDIPAVIITGDTHPERLREVQESGLRLMHKPVRPAQLRAFLRHLLRQEG